MVSKANVNLRGRVDNLKVAERLVETAAYDLHAKRLILESLKASIEENEKIDEELQEFEQKQQQLMAKLKKQKEAIKQQKIKFSSSYPGLLLSPPIKKRKLEIPVIRSPSAESDDDEDDLDEDDDEMKDFIDDLKKIGFDGKKSE